MATTLKIKKEDQLVWLTFLEENERRPCTLDWAVLAELDKALDRISGDGGVRAVVLQSASSKSFIVGANIQALQTLDSENIVDWVKNGHRVFNKLQSLPVPVIAKVESYALGGGLELAMACDIIVASTDAKFAQPEASLGVMPGWGGSYRLAMLAGPNRAKEMFFTGRTISAAQAYDWGIVNHVCEREELDGVICGIIEDIKKNDAGVLALVKEIVNGHTQKGVLHNAFEEATTSAVCMASPGTRQRLEDFFASRKK